MYVLGKTHNTPLKALSPYKSIKIAKSIAKDILKIALKIALSLGIDIVVWVVNLFTGFIGGAAIGLVLNTALELAFDYFDNKEIKWKDIGMAVLKGGVSTILGLSAFSKLGKYVAKGVKYVNTGKQVFKTATNIIASPVETSIDILKHASIKAVSKVAKIAPKVQKVVHLASKITTATLVLKNNVEVLVNAKNNPLNATKFFANETTSLIKKSKTKLFNNLWDKNQKINLDTIKKANPKHFDKNKELNPQADKNTIFLNSKWIYALKPLPETEATKNLNIFTYFILFNQATTNNKKLIRREGAKEIYTHEFEEFIKAPSAGKYYIDNISWGWDFNKLRVDVNKRENKRHAMVEAAEFEALSHYENIRKTLVWKNQLDDKSLEFYKQHINSFRGRDFGNILINEYKTARGKKVKWRTEHWVRRHQKNTKWTKKSNHISSSLKLIGAK
ncbi:hypothetical protein [[Mycoplasma] anseris]|uniref:Uncharacterized protein n=1 Tax=[Mycoplasma] anseris TaxID=92400 RepID=A0A2Z4NDW5_9BACT|nr:hypothetical protein [[Mycoplasma] anseris]AWX69696.1 hypothetical protein DP065_02995 [[Mycoplasma] anseris]